MQKDKHLYNELHCDQWQLGGNFMDKLHPIFQGFMVWAILLSKQPSWGVFSILGVEEFTTDINPLNIHKCEDQLMGHCGNRKKGQQLK